MSKYINIKKTIPLDLLKPIEGILFLTVVSLSVWLLTTAYYMYAILPALVILTLFFLNRNPQYGYFLIIFLIPFGDYREILSSNQFLTISKFLGIAIFVIVIFHLLLKKGHSLPMRSNLWPLLLIFFILCFFSTVLSSYPLTSMDNMRKLLTGIIIFGLTLIFIPLKVFKMTLPIIIISSTSMTSILAIIGYVFNIPYFAMDIESMKRASGLLGSPNHFAFLILFSLPLLAHYFFYSSKSLIKFISCSLFLISIASIILTYSRGAAIVLSVILFLLLIENIRRLKPRYLGFIGMVFIVAMVLAMNVVPSSYWERQRSTFSDTTGDSSINRRISYLYVAKDIVRDNPIFGAGIGTFKDIYAASRYAREYVTTEGLPPERYAHNTYLEILTGTGILGLIVFCLIMILTIKNFNKAKNIFLKAENHDMASLVSAYRLSFIAILIYFFMLSGFYHKYFWLSLGFSQIALVLSQNPREEKVSDNIGNTY